MKRVEEVILVEGRYDKNTLLQTLDAVVLESAGFGIFHDRQKQRLLRTLAEKHGLIVLTDSDGAGFLIRGFVKGCVPPELVKHAYIPDIPGKERRKSKPSREGKLGVEGMRPEVLLEVLRRAGARFSDEEEPARASRRILKSDLYAAGLSGGRDSREKRAQLLRRLDLPERLTADGLLDVLNALMSREEFFDLLRRDPPDRPGEEPLPAEPAGTAPEESSPE